MFICIQFTINNVVNNNHNNNDVVIDVDDYENDDVCISILPQCHFCIVK